MKMFAVPLMKKKSKSFSPFDDRKWKKAKNYQEDVTGPYGSCKIHKAAGKTRVAL